MGSSLSLGKHGDSLQKKQIQKAQYGSYRGNFLQLDKDLSKGFCKSWNGPDHFVINYVINTLAMVTAIAIFKLQLWSSPSEAYIYRIS